MQNPTSTQQGTVLVLALDTGLGEGVRNELEQAGLVVDMVSDMEQAMHRAASLDHVAYAVDTTLSGGAAYRFVAALREAGHEQPVLFLAAPHAQEDMLAVQRGWPDWEPVVREGLHDVPRALRALIRHERPDMSRRLRYAAIVLDRLERRVCIGGSEITVTPVEWSILEHLVLNAEHVLQRADLVVAVWGPDPDLRSNALEVHMGHVRRKLSDAGLNGVIETIRGRGYMLRIRETEEDDAA